ncbi:hypothetical protein BDV97DRAFT_218380 [Delphinella strobiligena]|nr:hypothetical protein BDV97DRAFT_218380 [Delphinella strobiligena]
MTLEKYSGSIHLDQEDPMSLNVLLSRCMLLTNDVSSKIAYTNKHLAGSSRPVFSTGRRRPVSRCDALIDQDRPAVATIYITRMDGEDSSVLRETLGMALVQEALSRLCQDDYSHCIWTLPHARCFEQSVLMVPSTPSTAADGADVENSIISSELCCRTCLLLERSRDKTFHFSKLSRLQILSVYCSLSVESMILFVFSKGDKKTCICR